MLTEFKLTLAATVLIFSGFTLQQLSPTKLKTELC